MKHLLSRNRRWKRSDRLYKTYGDFELFDIGPMQVQTNDIIGLSHHPNTIKDDDQMHSLKESISEKGWQDKHFKTLHLVRMPDGNLPSEQVVIAGFTLQKNSE